MSMEHNRATSMKMQRLSKRNVIFSYLFNNGLKYNIQKFFLRFFNTRMYRRCTHVSPIKVYARHYGGT